MSLVLIIFPNHIISIDCFEFTVFIKYGNKDVLFQQIKNYCKKNYILPTR